MNPLKDHFLDIFEYQHHFNQQMADVLAEHADRVDTKAVPLFSHIINAHQIWNTRIVGGEALGVSDVHSIARCKELDGANYTATVQILQQVELDKLITYKNTRGQEFHNRVNQILFHVNNHTTHHRGQIAVMLRQAGITPPVTDYIFYKR